MVIYLDSNLIQYCADEKEFVLGRSENPRNRDETLGKELSALKTLAEMDQFADWQIAASPMLVAEIFRGKPTRDQIEAYPALLEAWRESDWEEKFPIDGEEIHLAESYLKPLKLSSADSRHLAQAITLNASWFLTNDQGILKKCKKYDLPIRVSSVSECLDEIGTGLFLK